MNTLDLGAIPPLSLHGPVCWAQRPYFIKRAHLQVLHWERDTALVGRGEVMIGELGDDWERGEGGQDECKQKNVEQRSTGARVLEAGLRQRRKVQLAEQTPGRGQVRT